MLKRKVTQQLYEWKNREKKKCMLVKGARQVGKTYAIRAFGEEAYENFLEINFLREPQSKQIFAGELTGNEILKRITAYYSEARIVPGKTLLFLDEIQKCPNARTALKFLAEDRRVDVIASGSLLGLSYGRDDDPEVGPVPSIPVGYEDTLMLYSLDFEEYLWACGYSEDAISILREHYERGERLLPALHEKYEQLVREYIVVGGMPEVVADFVENHDFNRVHEIQEALIAGYEDDIAQHAKGVEKVKVRRCYDSIPAQLARENKKFKFSEVEHKSTAKKYGDSIQWLVDSNLALRCTNLTQPIMPLRFNEKENEFKLYINDTGLLMSIFGKETKLAVLNNSLRGPAKGGIYENYVAEALVKRGYDLHYYRPDDNSELEFIIERSGGVIPIEVKAGNTATLSLNRFLENFEPEIAYKVMDGNPGIVGRKYSIPHYMIMFL